jgi:hypothetical protein
MTIIARAFLRATLASVVEAKKQALNVRKSQDKHN